MLSVETGEFLRSAQDVGNIVVGVHGGAPVYLREVARVEAGAQQPQRYVWFTPGAAMASAGEPAATAEVATGRPGLPGRDAHRDQEAGRERGRRGARRQRARRRPCATP